MLSRVALVACLCACLLVVSDARLVHRRHYSSRIGNSKCSGSSSSSSSSDHSKDGASTEGDASGFKLRGTNNATDSMGTQDGENANNKKALDRTQPRINGNADGKRNPNAASIVERVVSGSGCANSPTAREFLSNELFPGFTPHGLKINLYCSLNLLTCICFSNVLFPQ